MTGTSTAAPRRRHAPVTGRPRHRRWLALAGAALVGGAGLLAVQAASGPPPPPRAMPEVPATAMDLQRKPANNSPAVATDPTDSRFVVIANRRDGPEFGCALQVSGDGGRTWLSANPVPELPEGVDTCYAPEVAFSREGVLHYLFVGLAGPGNRPVGAWLTTSEDRARSFRPPVKLLGPGNYQVRMALDRDTGRLHLAWLHTTGEPTRGGLPPPPNPILTAHSDDGGRTLSEPVRVSDPDRQRVVAPALEVRGGTVHVAYYDLKGDRRDYQGLEGPTWQGTWELVTATSRDGGRTVEPGVVVEDAVVPPERVMLIFTMAPPAVATSADGHVYTAWHDARNGDWDAFLRASRDAGRTWGGPVRLNDDPVGSGPHQYLPQVAVAPGGRVDAVFYDRRHNEENRGNDLTYTYSTDGGASFAPNRRLTSLDSDSRIGPRYAVPSAAGMREFGSRIGLSAAPGRAVAAWTDTRNTGRAPPAQDIFATTVVHPRPDRWPGVLGGLLLAAGLAGLAATRLGGRRTGAAAALLAGTVGGCAPPQGSPPPPRPPVVNVVMEEYSFTLDRPVPAGRVVFQVRNEGTTGHDLVLAPLAEDIPPIHEQLRGEERRFVEPLAGIPSRPPGATGTFAVDLAPGRYALLCFEADPDGVVHARKGMARELRVR